MPASRLEATRKRTRTRRRHWRAGERGWSLGPRCSAPAATVAGPSRPQQVEQRAHASGPAEIMDDVEGHADGVAAEPAERGEGAKLGVDVVPGDAELARTLGGVDRAGEA